ncbi:MAG: FAD-dependent protein [Burkholderiaceae bacterium]
MIRLTELKLPLDHSPADLAALMRKTLGLDAATALHYEVFKRSIDARKANLLVVYIVDLQLASPAEERALLASLTGHPHLGPTPDMAYWLPSPVPSGRAGASALRPVVVGFGPCGILAALLLAQMGLKPIVLERGKPVRERTRDTWDLWRNGILHPESNAQFGEGGAGTFSDGKLWSQIKDPRHLGRKVMHELVRAGAPPEILVDAHPHIGTFRLVKVVENMREQIIALGGEVRFGQRVTDVTLQHCAPDVDGRLQRVQAVTVLDVLSGASYELPAAHAVLALGHSARDTFAMLHARGVFMEPKAFSIGFRIEHPQGVIDRARWGRHAGHPALGAAEYRLVHHASNGRAVYSFCMCPGGTVVAATSEVGCVATNGMSQYSRNERNANAGIVVGITPEDFPSEAAALNAMLASAIAQAPTTAERAAPSAMSGVHPLAGIVLQRQLEAGAYTLGGSNYRAPAQLLGDFVASRASTRLGGVVPSYKPGVALTDLSRALPDYAIHAIREALPMFGRRIKGFDMPEAVLTGVETRTSSPVRLTRGADFQSVSARGLYPAGEGAGYAGGILSAGVDGIRMAEAVAAQLAAEN